MLALGIFLITNGDTYRKTKEGKCYSTHQEENP